jgi:hypothetical protein
MRHSCSTISHVFLALFLAVLPGSRLLAEATPLRIQVEVVEYDCANSHLPVEECATSLGSAARRPFGQNDLSDIAPGVSKAQLNAFLTPGEPLKDSITTRGGQLDVELSSADPVDGRYLIDLWYSFADSRDNDEMAGSTQMLITPGKGPVTIGSSLSSHSSPGSVAAAQKVIYTAVLLNVDVPSQ